MRENAIELLEFLGLADKRDAKASDLPYGDQRKLEMARALATRPRLLLLDEPAAGLNPHETEELDEVITRIRDRGVTIILVEHDMRLVMGISDRVTVLNFGTKIAEGTPGEIQNEPGRDRGLSRRGRAAMSMLGIKGLRSGYGKIEVLHDLDMDIEQGQIVTLIGANGAGKTTLLKTISGLLRPSAGTHRIRRRQHRAPAAAQDRRARHQPRARGPRHPQAHDRDRQPAHGRLCAQRRRGRRRHRERADALPGARRTAPADGRHAQRRRAADAGDRARAGGAAAAACCSTSLRSASRPRS